MRGLFRTQWHVDRPLVHPPLRILGAVQSVKVVAKISLNSSGSHTYRQQRQRPNTVKCSRRNPAQPCLVVIRLLIGSGRYPLVMFSAFYVLEPVHFVFEVHQSQGFYDVYLVSMFCHDSVIQAFMSEANPPVKQKRWVRFNDIPINFKACLKFITACHFLFILPQNDQL